MPNSTAFDRLTELAAAMFDAPIALITALDEDRQWFRSNRGYRADQATAEESFCRHMIGSEAGTTLVVQDAILDGRFVDNRLVTEEGVRFYAGAVITTADGKQDGAVCVLDTLPRGAPTEGQMESLKLLARLAGQEIDHGHLLRAQAKHTTMMEMAEELAGLGRWRYDIASGKVDWSDQVYRIHGKSRATFDPSFDDAVGCYHPDDRLMVEDCCARAIRTGEGGEIQVRLIREDGEERIVKAACRPERDGDGPVTALFGVFQDVTDLARSQQKVEASEALYRLLAANSTDVIGTYGMDGRFRYLSPSVEGIMGYRAEALVGRASWDFIHPADARRVRKAFADYARAGPEAVPPRIPYRAIRKDGTEIWLEAHPKVIRDAQGRAVEYQDVVRDITATKRLEDELVAARDVAEAAARSKSEFLANMSHELRTPLTSVIGFSGLLQASEALPETERRYADRIAATSEALLGVINDVLDYSKLEADAVGLDPVAFDPAAMARSAALIVETQCQDKGLTLAVTTSGDLPEAIIGDEGRVRQVTLNFLSNAMKFTASGLIGLDVGIVGERLRVTVTDSGIGIAPDRIDVLFERFTQADASTRRVYGGTGLGLAICRRLVDMMGGEIGATSRPGHGSTFWFEVPLIAVEPLNAMSDEVLEGLPNGLRVLLADDAPAYREQVRVLMDAWGINLTTVCDGAEAVQAAATGGYDLILMDVHMPVMDGMDACRTIRALGSEAAATPILALTAAVLPEQVEACHAAGMDGHVGKPIEVVALIEAMVKALDVRKPFAYEAAA